MEWFRNLFTGSGVAQAVVVYGLVIALGVWFGRLKISGIALGVTGILFIGLVFSQSGIVVDRETQHFLRDFGLILFVYSIGLQVGPGFFASLKKNAIGNNILAATLVVLGVIITVAFFLISGYSIGVMTGVMSGAVTNTPGLAAAQATIKNVSVAAADDSLMTLAYALTYPFGVVGVILSLILLKKIFRINVDKEKERHRKLDVLRSNGPVSIHLNVENKQLVGQPLNKILGMLRAPVVVARMLHAGQVTIPNPDVKLAEGDVLLMVAQKHNIEEAKMLIGSTSTMNLEDEPNSKLSSKKIIVTRKEVTHKPLCDIDEINQTNFTLTRLNRAGIEMVPHSSFYLQLGDIVNVVGTEDGLQLVTRTLGNSLKRLEAPDLAPTFIGIVLGVVLGSIPIYFPGMPVPVKIGLAGGPLIVALVLSRFGNTLYLNNYTTTSANLMIRELGISLFLASVGLGSGSNLLNTIVDMSGWTWILMGIVITILPMVIVGILARRLFDKTYFEICGILAGASTDPPALAFALKMAGNDIPTATYATVYPLTMILRIVAAQLLVLLLS